MVKNLVYNIILKGEIFGSGLDVDLTMHIENAGLSERHSKI